MNVGDRVVFVDGGDDMVSELRPRLLLGMTGRVVEVKPADEDGGEAIRVDVPAASLPGAPAMTAFWLVARRWANVETDAQGNTR